YGRAGRRTCMWCRCGSGRCGAGSCGPGVRAMIPVPRCASVPPTGTSRLGQAQQACRVLLEDLGADLVLDLELREVREPAVRGQDRVVRAEEDLVLEERVRVLDQLGREVLRGPA